MSTINHISSPSATAKEHREDKTRLELWVILTGNTQTYAKKIHLQGFGGGIVQIDDSGNILAPIKHLNFEEEMADVQGVKFFTREDSLPILCDQTQMRIIKYLQMSTQKRKILECHDFCEFLYQREAGYDAPRLVIDKDNPPIAGDMLSFRRSNGLSHHTALSLGEDYLLSSYRGCSGFYIQKLDDAIQFFRPHIIRKIVYSIEDDPTPRSSPDKVLYNPYLP